MLETRLFTTSKLFIPILFIGLLLVSSCNKNHDDPIEENTFGEKPDPADLDRSSAEGLYGTWTLIAWDDDVPQDINNDGNASNDLFSQWDGCFKESQFVLSAEPAAKIVYTGLADNPSCAPDFETGDYRTTDYWDIEETSGQLFLRFIGDDYYDIYQIIELTETSLVIQGAGFLTCCDPDISYYTGGYLSYTK